MKMSKSENKNFLIFPLILILLSTGSLLRIYNINYDDFWIDEMVSFWVSDPKISLFESYQRNNISEGFPFLFNLILKILHKVFGYEIYIGRYVSTFFGILSILSVGYLSRIVKSDNSYLVVIFFISFNVFLIKYSQEARAYSFIFFLSSITLIFFCRLIKSYYNKKDYRIDLIFFTIFQILLILTYPLSIIIFFSIIFYVLILYLKDRKIIKPIFNSLLLILLFLILYLPFYFNNTFVHASWLQQPDLNFYTNFYFSKFFGSRILGIFHILLLSFLIIKFRYKFFKKYELKLLFLIIIIFSYSMPISYGYIFEPILHQRYIIFIIIPIILLTSHLIFEIQSSSLKNILLSTCVIITILNQFTEVNFQQFYEKRPFFKPEISKALKIIDNSEYKNFSFNKNLHISNNESEENTFAHKAIKNYILKLAETNNLKINYRETNLNNDKFLWIICTELLIGSKCDNPTYNKKFKIIENKDFNRINIKLINFL